MDKKCLALPSGPGGQAPKEEPDFSGTYSLQKARTESEEPTSDSGHFSDPGSTT